MMEGMAASSSIAVPTGPRSQGGASSVRKKAMPKATGTASRMARIGADHGAEHRDEGAVLLAPSTGFQAVLHRKPRPNSRKAGRPPTNSVTMMAPSSTSTKSPAPRHRRLEDAVAHAGAASAAGSRGAVS